MNFIDFPFILPLANSQIFHFSPHPHFLKWIQQIYEKPLTGIRIASLEKRAYPFQNLIRFATFSQNPEHFLLAQKEEISWKAEHSHPWINHHTIAIGTDTTVIYFKTIWHRLMASYIWHTSRVECILSALYIPYHQRASEIGFTR